MQPEKKTEGFGNYGANYKGKFVLFIIPDNVCLVNNTTAAPHASITTSDKTASALAETTGAFMNPICWYTHLLKIQSCHKPPYQGKTKPNEPICFPRHHRTGRDALFLVPSFAFVYNLGKCFFFIHSNFSNDCTS
jgi:hypothetical protein